MSPYLRPTVLIIPGAFHRTSSFNTLIPHLDALGFSTAVAAYPSLNPQDPTSATLAADVASIREKHLQPLIDTQGKDIILLLHSFGGVVGGGAATGYSKSERLSQGKAGGIIGLMYIAGNIVPEGQSVLDLFGGVYPPILEKDTPSAGLVSVVDAIPLFYADIEPSTAAALKASLLPHSMLALESLSSTPAWTENAYSGRLAYLTCTLDACLPLAVQEAWIQKTGVAWAVRRVEGSHTAFVSKAKEVAEFVAEFASIWAKAEML